jgi:ABC-type antimicrobial peptide transport system permease subunit
MNPPKFPLRFFRWFCHPKLRDSIEGDLLELYQERVKEQGKRKADLQFTWDVLLLFRKGIIKPTEGYKSLNTYGMYKSYFKIGWRNLVKSKGYSLINIGGLALGMIATMLILLYIQDERSYDTFHSKSPVLYRIVTDWVNPDGSVRQHDGNTGHFQGPKFMEKIPEITNNVRWRPSTMTFKINNEVKDMEVFFADTSFFTLFSFPLLAGNKNTALKEPYSIVISEAKAKLYFNTTEALGKILDIKEDTTFRSYQVTGVVKTIPYNSSIKFDFIVPNIVSKEEYASNENWFNMFQNTFVELHPSANPRVVESKMKQVYESDAAATIQMMKEKYNVTEKATYLLQPLTDLHLSKLYTASNGLQDASNPMFSYILSGIALFILMIACINFVNLSIANSLKRAKEIGVRKVVGGAKSNLTIQFLSESLVTCFLAFAIALVFVPLCLPVFNALAVKSLSFENLLSAKLLAAYFLLFATTGILAGLYPALILSGFNPVKTLYGRFRFSGKNFLQRALVIVQFSLAAFLIMATITIYSQFDFLTSYDLGYDDKDLVMVNKHPITPNQFKVFKDALESNPNIIGVAPKNGGEWGTVAKVNSEQLIKFQYNIIDDAYLPLLKIPIVAGRGFSPDFTADGANSVIVNEAFIKEAGWKDPIGQSVNFWYRNQKYSVVGIVKNHHFNSLAQEVTPQLFVHKPDENYGKVFIKLSGKNNQEALAHIEKTFKNQFPDFTYSYTFKENENQEQYQLEARWNKIVLVSSVLTILISCVGLLGLATLAAKRRAKEIGVRKVLGASIASITKLLSFNFILLVCMAFAFAIPAAYFASNEWLSTYAYRIHFSYWTVVITLLITVGISLITVCSQAIRTALANPVKSLRTE